MKLTIQEKKIFALLSAIKDEMAKTSVIIKFIKRNIAIKPKTIEKNHE